MSRLPLRWLPPGVVICAALLACADASGGATKDELAWVDRSALLAPRFGKVRFEARDGHLLSAYVYRATGFDPKHGRIWFVMHGAGRNAKRYLEAAAPMAERYDTLAIAIEFSEDAYRRQEDYTLQVGGFAEVERVFDGVTAAIGGRQRGYYLFGHSAGAQFVHRLVTFLPDARVLGAVAANAGWYTLPVVGDEPAAAMPYGLRGSALERADLRGLFGAPLTVLVGARDTKTPSADRLLRDTPEAMAQGETRFARGQYYYATARTAAAKRDTAFNWRLAVVPRAGHEVTEMVASAMFFLFHPEKTPCEPTPAAGATGLVIDEILADPPDDRAGDANADGVRDPADDEFVRIVNTGKTSVCLTGWSLGDASKSERHVFPVGDALAPGRALLVFGGGVPTGRFGGADVQWAAFDGRLSLSNDGDVLTLRDAADAVVRQVSWGDCAGAPCARDHRSGLRPNGKVSP
jgi:hypothetical protein